MPSDAKTPPPTSSRSPPPPGSPSEVSSHRPRSPVFEQGGPSEKTLVVDLSSSSDEEDHIPDTCHDFEFAQRLYDELNRALLGLTGDGKIIILSDSNKEEEAREETATDAKVVPFVAVAAVKPLTPTASPADADEDPGATPNDSNDGLAPG
jgi:hypothetical protein